MSTYAAGTMYSGRLADKDAIICEISILANLLLSGLLT